MNRRLFLILCLLVVSSVYCFKIQKSGLNSSRSVDEIKIIDETENFEKITKIDSIEQIAEIKRIDEVKKSPEIKKTEQQPLVKNAAEKQICKDNICINTTEDDKGVSFSVKNTSVSYITVYFSLKTENLGYPTSRDIVVTVKPDDIAALADLKYENSKLESSWTWDYKLRFGSIYAVPDDTLYSLPFESGKKFIVCQSYGGTFSHNTKETYYAVDFVMPEGTPILAARDGIVVKVKDISDKGGPDRSFIEDANTITIMHEDGTIGVYAHLKQYGASVREGETVRSRDVIGYSGNTGFSTLPHLHFYVAIPDKTVNRSLSIPVKFETAYGIRERLEEKSLYKAL